MGENRLERVSSNVDKGVDTFSSDFSLEMHFTENTYNVSQGIKHGIGPRFGISPIPGHSHTDDVDTQPVGVMQAENSNGSSNARLQARYKFFGVIPFSMKTFVSGIVGATDYGTRGPFKTHFMWFYSIKPASSFIVDASMNGKRANNRVMHDSDIAEGVLPRGGTNPGAVSTMYNNVVSTVFTIDSDIYHAKIAALSIKTKAAKFSWIIGSRMNVADATHTSDLDNYGQIASRAFFAPSCIPAAEFDISRSRDITFYNLYYSAGSASSYTVASLAYIYTYRNTKPVSGDTLVDNRAYNKYYAQAGAATLPTTYFNGTAGVRTVRDDGVTPAYGEIEGVLLNDPLLEGQTNYTAFFIAARKALMIACGDFHADTVGVQKRYLDLQENAKPPVNISTLQDAQNAGAYYTEDAGETRSTCFRRWPLFVRGTALGKDSAASYDGYTHVTLGAANSGILRKNTVYEFAFSMYDKVFDFETNVGTPAKIQTGLDDYVALSLYRDEKSGPTWLQRCPLSRGNTAGTQDYYNYMVLDIWDSYNANCMPNVNYKELRVYYREEGSYEWLPALFIDAAKYYGYPNHHVLWACQAPIASIPGGQPGGFNDYSPLDNDKYIDALTFRERVFWLSPQKVVYSYRKNPFCYAGRNSVACPTGEFRGMIAHAYPGQSEQNSRIIIFGSAETYVGRFTGQPELATVVVSPDTIGQYPVDGSDFYVDTWTSFTSFSGRSAVVANGVLFYWGEKGIFADTGAALPERISRGIEPDLHGLYDPNKIDEIHAHYFDATKEIYWFYPPSRDNTITDAVVFNTRSGEFMFARFSMKIDSVQDVNITNTDADRDTNGLRAVASIRKDSSETIQRAYFLDVRNRAGDMRPETEFLIKTIASPSTTTRRLALAGGYDATNFGTLAVGDKVCIQQGAAYSDDATITDMIANISALGAGTIDIALPTGASFKSAATLDTDKYFPIWIDRHNQFPYYIETNYWTPKGIDYWTYWEFIHMLFRISLLTATANPQLTLSYRTPISDAAVSNTLTLTDNSDGHCQIWTPLKSSGQSFEGQALKWLISGNHIGHEWVLQYLGADIGGHQGEGTLLHFEG